MNREYDIFEKVEGSLLWRCSVLGLDPSMARLKELAEQSTNEFTLMHLGSNAVIARLNAPGAPQ
jgi:hypothetical protein